MIRELFAIIGNAEMCIHNMSIRVNAYSNFKDVSTIGIQSIKPIPVIKISISCAGNCYWCNSLVDWVVIKGCYVAHLYYKVN